MAGVANGAAQGVAHGVDAARAGAVLTIDLDAIRANYRLLRETAAGASCAAVMKADAYGLGMDIVAPALALEGCRVFFTAHLEEGVRLRQIAPADSAIYVLHGPPPGTAADFVRHGLVPVLNDPSQIEEWRRAGRLLQRRLPAALQFDTGMSRMGLAPCDVDALLADPAWKDELEPVLVMSHLACADEPEHPMNDLQRARFAQLRARFPGIPGSLANSSAVFLGQGFRHDLVRPGAALYGINPQPGHANPLRQAVSLHARIVQSRMVAAGDVVGYGARHAVTGPARIATIGIGYADGWLRSLSGRGHAWIDGMRVPFAGNVSMDSITLDVSGIDEARVAPGQEIELLGSHQTVDEVAREAGTIGYEVLTRLGGRFHRRYA
ncbi:alanine racemase [Massilia sp. WF1]|uniref:alanine racemase n=1 Tax=unclassified Massilia TaxID=2609279 RepID=UPI00064B3D15|nr:MULTISPECIES: alanine racemase [unclassified Massilia]ALK97509.1 alanine racemase [Massilia sp. WG5]KLU36692.1 alanine racemase [Massilia sp. WF1]